MTISEAMRQGAALHPQAFGVSWKNAQGTLTVIRDEVQATCALGAVTYVLGGGWVAPYTTALARPEICPKCGRFEMITQLVMHLNDGHHEPRERIADWLEDLGL